MPNLAQLILPLLGALSLLGCATMEPRRSGSCFRGLVDDPLLEQQLEASPSCCEALSSLPFQAFPRYDRSDASGGRQTQVVSYPAGQEPFEPRETSIDRTAPVFAFAEGKSRFVAFDLATLERRPSGVMIFPLRSGFTTTATSCDGQRFAARMRYIRPIVTLLDESRRPLDQSREGTPTQLASNGALWWSFPESARYLVIHSEPGRFRTPFLLRGEPTTAVTFFPGAAGLVMIPVTLDGTVNGLATSTGELRLQFQ